MRCTIASGAAAAPMRAEAWRSSFYTWVARLDQFGPCQGRARLKLGLELRPAVCVVTWSELVGRRGAVAKSGIFGCSRGPRRDAIRARGSVLAGAEPRGTCLVPSGCSVTGLTRATCDARARPRGCARRGFSPNVSDRLLGSSGPALLAGRSQGDGGRSLLLRGAARAAHGPGEGRRVGQIRRPNHSRSQRVAIQMMPLLRRWQPPCVRYAQSQGSCTRGRARGGRRARLNLMPPCRLGPKSAEPNTYSEPPKCSINQCLTPASIPQRCAHRSGASALLRSSSSRAPHPRPPR